MTDLQLPTEPTFGFITTQYNARPTFGMWTSEGTNAQPQDQPALIEVSVGGSRVDQWYRIESFIPAVAIPAPMLNKLREVWYEAGGDNYWTGPLANAVKTLLVALEGTIDP